MENIIQKVETDIENVGNKIGVFFTKLEKNFVSDESKILAINVKSQQLTDFVEKLQSSPTVEQIEAAIGNGYGTTIATEIVALIQNANIAIHLIDTQKNLDAVNGILVMLGARISSIIGETGNIVLTIGEWLISFQKLFNLK